MKTGNTRMEARAVSQRNRASMEPGHEDREYVIRGEGRLDELHASMEPGHEDREYAHRPGPDLRDRAASMEPGHEDREY